MRLEGGSTPRGSIGGFGCGPPRASAVRFQAMLGFWGRVVRGLEGLGAEGRATLVRVGAPLVREVQFCDAGSKGSGVWSKGLGGSGFGYFVFTMVKNYILFCFNCIQLSQMAFV